MKMLVTGGCGFIGSNYILEILHRHPTYEIVNLDTLTYSSNLRNLDSLDGDPRYRFVKGDICDVDVVEAIMPEIDAVIHFAAESHVDRSILSAEEFVRTNVLGTQILLDSALRHGKKRFHHISTDEVFGELGPRGKFRETTHYNPRSPYSASKAASDHLVRAYFHTHGLPITISNCSNNYGPFQFPEKLIPLAVTNLLEGKQVPVYGAGKNIRDWIFVQDHVDAIDKILHQGKIGETYCVGGDSEYANMEIVNMLLEILGKDLSYIHYVTDRKGHDFRYAIDFTKISKELGWTPKHSLKEGLEFTVRWYKDNPKWWKPLKQRVISDITKKQ